MQTVLTSSGAQAATFSKEPHISCGIIEILTTQGTWIKGCVTGRMPNGRIFVHTKDGNEVPVSRNDIAMYEFHSTPK